MCAGLHPRNTPKNGVVSWMQNESLPVGKSQIRFTRRSYRNTTYEPEQEMASGMGVLPG